jgi:hypothetical protein
MIRNSRLVGAVGTSIVFWWYGRIPRQAGPVRRRRLRLLLKPSDRITIMTTTTCALLLHVFQNYLSKRSGRNAHGGCGRETHGGEWEIRPLIPWERSPQNRNRLRWAIHPRSPHGRGPHWIGLVITPQILAAGFQGVELRFDGQIIFVKHRNLRLYSCCAGGGYPGGLGSNRLPLVPVCGS